MKNELIITERSFGNGIILDLRGDLTKQSEQTLLQWRKWEDGLEGRQALVFNMREVDMINSAGIALLIRLSQQALQARFSIYAYGISAHYQKMFRLIGLTEYITVYPDEYSLMLRLQ